METGFKEHFTWGLLLGIAFAYLLYSYFSYPIQSIFAPSLLFLISSLLPDIDSPSSKPRRYFRLFVFASFVAIALLYYSTLASIHFIFPFVFPFIGFAAVEFSIPGHRGFLHSPAAAILWGLFIFLFLRSPLAGIAAAFGYSTHLLVDYAGDRINL